MTQFATSPNSNLATNSLGSDCSVNREQITEMTKELFGPMFGIDIEASTQLEWSCDDVECTAWQASVCIDGDFKAEVQTIIPKNLAQRIACTMFGMTPDELTNIELADAMGEVVNIIGGNVKGIVGMESKLSLPCVAQYQSAIESPNLSVGFQCEDEHLIVLLKQS